MLDLGGTFNKVVSGSVTALINLGFLNFKEVWIFPSITGMKSL